MLCIHLSESVYQQSYAEMTILKFVDDASRASVSNIPSKIFVRQEGLFKTNRTSSCGGLLRDEDVSYQPIDVIGVNITAFGRKLTPFF